MKKIAIVSPLLLPVTKNGGGAVENLILNIVIQNEKNKNPLNIDLYTIYSPYIKDEFKFTKIYQIKKNVFNVFFQKVCNFVNKIFKRKYRFDYNISKTIKIISQNSYDKIIIENRMGIYKEIYEKTNNKNNLIYHMHNGLDNSDKTEEGYLFIEKTCYKILTVSNYIANVLKEIKNSSKIFTFYNSIDLNEFNNKKIKKEKLEKIAKSLRINRNDFVVGFVGRITKEKGIYELISAFEKFVKKYNNAKLLIVGSSWFTDKKLTNFETKLKNETNNIKNNIIFTGYIDYNNIMYYYKLMNVCVIPSLCHEAFGMVALESLAMNLTVISSKNGALPEVLKNNAIYVSNENIVNDIYESLLRVVNKEIINSNCNLDKFGLQNYYENFVNFIK